MGTDMNQRVFHPENGSMISVDRVARAGTPFIFRFRYILIAAIILLTVLATLWQDPVLSDDLFIALSGGRDICQGKLGTPDDWSFMTHGKVWMNQNWGSGFLFYLIYNVTGNNGLLVFKGLLVILWGLFLVMANRKRGNPPAISMGVSAIGMLLCIGYNDLRPNYLTFIFTSLELYLLYRIQEKPPRVWFILPAILVWANMHGGFVLGIILLYLWAVSFIIPKVLLKEKLNVKSFLHYITAAIVTTIFSGIFNPFGMQNLTQFFVVPSSSVWKNSTFDWTPIWNRQSYGNVVGFIIIACLLILLITVRFLIRKRNSNSRTVLTEFINSPASTTLIFEICASSLVILMAIFSRRFVPLALIISMPLFGRQIFWLCRFKVGKLIFSGLTGIVLVFTLYNLFYVDYFRFYQDSNREYPEETFLEKMHMSKRFFPKDLVSFINDNHISGNILCEWAWEGFIRWNCPQLKTFIGGRAQQVYDEKTFLAYLEIINGTGKAKTAKLLRDNDVELIAVQKKSGNENLIQKIGSKSKWRLIYEDNQSLLLANADKKRMDELVKTGLRQELIFRNHNIFQEINDVFIWAVTGNYLNEAASAMQEGADVNARNNQGDSALAIAANLGYTEIVKLLIRNGAKVNAQDEAGQTALFYAAGAGYSEIVQLFIEHQTDVNAKNKEGETSLHWAAQAGNPDIVRLLIEHGADLEAKTLKDNITPLMYAINFGHYETVKLLIENKANPNAVTRDHSPVLGFCLYKDKNDEIMKLLIKHGANVNYQDPVDGTTLLMSVINSGKIETAKILIENGALVNAQNEFGDTALMRACRNRELERVKLLVKNKADVNLKDENGQTALYQAKQAGSKLIVDFLKAAHAK
ncbi:MAG TPA: ankyrin repeat domain-containing protein [Bacillota bacterium]|nr:ankyrin repeat domain-containing protein [Bacillota bacterium]